MNYTIKNEKISVEVSSLGAELQSIKYSGFEYLWQGASEFWTGRAPILFPIVGGLKNTEYLLKGQKYSMPNHGIIRINEFQEVECSDDEVTMTFTSTPETLKMYPFEFTMAVTYKLENNKIIATQKITNLSSEQMPFTFGLHTGFNLDDTLENSYIQLEDEPLISNIDNEGGFMVPKVTDYGQKNLHFHKDSFSQNNTIIFDTLKSREATLCFKNSDKKVKMEWNDDMPLLAIWAKANAPFVCIEPWAGLGDNKADTINELSDKRGMMILNSKESKNISYSIEII